MRSTTTWHGGDDADGDDDCDDNDSLTDGDGDTVCGDVNNNEDWDNNDSNEWMPNDPISHTANAGGRNVTHDEERSSIDEVVDRDNDDEAAD